MGARRTARTTAGGLPKEIALHPASFATYASGGKWSLEGVPHLGVISDALRDVALGKIPRLLIQSPPRHGKSELVSKYFPAWYIGASLTGRIILTSYESDFAASWGRKARDVLEEHGEDVFGVKVSSKSAARDEWELEADGGAMKTAGVGAGILGRGANVAIIDDPVKNAQEAMSKLKRERTWDWYISTLLSRLEPEGAVVVIMQRWHEDDLAGRILHREGRVEEGGEWLLLNFPALAEEDDILGREPGKALWADRYPEEVLHAQKERDAYWFACTPANTPILMGNFTEKVISQVCAGDEIVGFEHGSGRIPGQPEKRHRLVRSRVKRVFAKQDYVWDLQMESGRVVSCTEDHRWYIGRKRIGRSQYLPPKVGRRLSFVAPTTGMLSQEELVDWSYLAGIFDGEGSAKNPSALAISQSSANPQVVTRIHEVLEACGVDYTFYEYDAGFSNWSKKGHFSLRDRFGVSLKLLRHTRVAKKDQLVAGLYERGGMFVREQDRIVSMKRRDTPETVYALETDTGNYVAWGYASSNSQYQQHPQPLEGGLFERQWINYFYPSIEPNRDGNDERVFYLDNPEIPGRVRQADTSCFVTMDIATSTGADADYTVASVWRATFDGDLLLEDVVRKRIPLHEQMPLLMRINEQYRPYAIYIEQDGLGLAAVQAAKSAGLPIIGVSSRGKGPKEARAIPAAERTRMGKVYFRAYASWEEPVVEELLTFPTGRHDDFVDTMSLAAENMTLTGPPLPSLGVEATKQFGPYRPRRLY